MGDGNPRDALKLNSERYASYVWYGVPKSKCSPYELPAEGAPEELATAWKERSFWELWAGGKLNQFYLVNWALQQSDAAGLQACVRFVLRASNLASPNAAEGTLDALKQELTESCDGGVADAAHAAAKAAVGDIFNATRAVPHDAAAFRTSISSLLEAVPGSAIDCAAFFNNQAWGSALCRAQFITSRVKDAGNFGKKIKPLLIGVGGYGLVQLAFEDQWGAAFALKRQNVSMVVEKKHTEKALLELKITREINSPFLLDCSCAAAAPSPQTPLSARLQFSRAHTPALPPGTPTLTSTKRTS